MVALPCSGRQEIHLIGLQMLPGKEGRACNSIQIVTFPIQFPPSRAQVKFLINVQMCQQLFHQVLQIFKVPPLFCQQILLGACTRRNQVYLCTETIVQSQGTISSWIISGHNQNIHSTCRMRQARPRCKSSSCSRLVMTPTAFIPVKGICNRNNKVTSDCFVPFCLFIILSCRNDILSIYFCIFYFRLK